MWGLLRLTPIIIIIMLVIEKLIKIQVTSSFCLSASHLECPCIPGQLTIGERGRNSNVETVRLHSVGEVSPHSQEGDLGAVRGVSVTQNKVLT